MEGFSDYWENKVLSHIFNKTNYTPPKIYIGLSTAEPGDDGSGLVEPNGNGYSRYPTSGNDWNTASGGAIANANEVTFPQATGNWGTISNFILFDAEAGGNMLAYGQLNVPTEVNDGGTLKFAAGDINVTLN